MYHPKHTLSSVTKAFSRITQTPHMSLSNIANSQY